VSERYGGTNERERIRRAVSDQHYRISAHANEEMSEDDLEAHDVEQVLLTGVITRRLTHDLRDTRYEVTGDTTDGRQAAVVCRFLASGWLLIITAYTQRIE
jgi:uncharacterized protein DUF4258